MIEYKVIDAPATKFVGLAQNTTMDNISETCKKIWTDLMPNFNKLNSPSGKGYGIYYNATKEGCACMAAQEAGDEIPEGFVTHSMPGGKYAVFEHKGKAEGLKDTWGAIFKEHGEILDHSKTSLEVYPETWSDKEDDVCEIWVALK